MNKIFLILTLLFVSTIQSQNIERNDLIGEWVFKVNIKDVIKNSDELNGFEKLAARTFSGIIEKALDKTISRIKYSPGARVLIKTMNKLGAYTALVSGGFRHFTRVVKKELGCFWNVGKVNCRY